MLNLKWPLSFSGKPKISRIFSILTCISLKDSCANQVVKSRYFMLQVHGSVTGRNFKIKLRAEHIELLQSPWLIELGAFYVNCSGLDMGEPGEFFRRLSCDLSGDQPVITNTLYDSIKYEYSLTCAVCLVRYLLRSFIYIFPFFLNLLCIFTRLQ